MRIIAVLLVCLMAFVQMQCTGNETKHSSDFKTWAITSVEGGGIDGRLLAFSIDNTGTLLFEDRKNKASAEMKMVDAETLARMEALLKQLDVPNAKKKSDKKSECCDQVNKYLIVKLDGREYYPDKSSFSRSQTPNFESLLSIFGQIAEENNPLLRNRAAELKIKNAKTLSLSVKDANYKPVWEGKFSRKGQSNVFEGEWKNNETAETVKDKVEVVLNGQIVKVTRKGAGEVAVPKEFQGDLDGYHPGAISNSSSQKEVRWYVSFE